MRLSRVALFLASAFTVVNSTPVAFNGMIARGEVMDVARRAEAEAFIEMKRAPAPTPTSPDWRREPEPTSPDWRREASPQTNPDWRREPSAQNDPDW